VDGAAGPAPHPALGGPVAAWVPAPAIEDVDISGVLAALADPVRLEIVRRLAQRGESTCTALAMPQSPPTLSHHMRVLRAAGLVATRVEGTARPSRLRRAELQGRFPGLLDAVLAAAG
jgi:DNA-binding transcriptional ArsR family regulator